MDWIVEFVFLLTLRSFVYAEIYDVTTLYRTDETNFNPDVRAESTYEAEVHSRTNAEGLPILVGRDIVAPLFDVPGCMASQPFDQNGCKWRGDDVTWSVHRSPSTFILNPWYWKRMAVSTTNTPYQAFGWSIFLEFTGFIPADARLRIIFTNNTNALKHQDKFYVIQLDMSGPSALFKCDGQGSMLNLTDSDGSHFEKMCSEKKTFTTSGWTLKKEEASNPLNLYVQHGNFQVWTSRELVRWADPQGHPLNYYTMEFDPAKNYKPGVRVYNQINGVTLSTGKKEFLFYSPWFTPKSTEMCVSIVYYTEFSGPPGVMLNAVDAESRRSLEIAELPPKEAGWSFEKLSFTLPSDWTTQIKIDVLVNRVGKNGSLQIQRLGGCKADGEEDIFNFASKAKIAYNVAIEEKPLNVGDVWSAECVNGGVAKGKNKCACPPGFTGDLCDQACEQDRYGLDCLGRCGSGTCSGYTLCSPYLGCNCASGYTGAHCNQTCAQGQYGVGCSLRCQNCDGDCNAFSGECLGQCHYGFDPPFCRSNRPVHTKVVVCYVASWSGYRSGLGKFTVDNLQPRLCTHIVYAFASIDEETHKIKSASPYTDLEENSGKGLYKQMTDLKATYTHLKVLLSVGGWNMGSAPFSKMASSLTYRVAFIKSVVDYLREYGFDGLDINWEYPTQRGGAAHDKANFVALVSEMHSEFNKYGYQLTAHLSGKKYIVQDAYDLHALSQHLDFINIVTYQYNTHHDKKLGPNAPIKSNNVYNIDFSISHFVEQGVPPDKLVMGIAAYGHSFILTQEPHGNYSWGIATIDSSFKGPYTKEEGFMGYNEKMLTLTMPICNDSHRGKYLKKPIGTQFTTLPNF